MKRSFFFLMMAAFAVISCTVEELVEPPQYEQKEVTITASFPADGTIQTKTVLVDGADVYWNPQDQIKVFSAGVSSKFTSLNTEPVSTANFTGMISVVSGTNESIEDSYIWGLYPYRADATYSEGKITTTLPAWQEGVEGTFADDLLITMGRSLNFSIPFYNVCSGLKFSLTQEGIKYVTLTATGGEMIAGTFKVGLDGEGKPKVSEVVDGSSSITVAAPDGGSFKTGVWYYIVTLPVTFSEGVTFSLSTGSLKGTRTIASSFSLSRGMFSRSTGLDKNIEINQEDDTSYNAYDVAEDLNTPLCLECVEQNAIYSTIRISGKPGWEVEYSKDGKNWQGYQFVDRSSQYSDGYTHTRELSISVYKGERVYFRSTALQEVIEEQEWFPGVSYSGSDSNFFEHLNIHCHDGKFYVYGNVMSLVAGEDYVNCRELPGPYTFSGLFASDEYEKRYLGYLTKGENTYSDSNIDEYSLSFSPTRNLVLPATILSECCYERMFAGCKGIDRAPELPASELAWNCYNHMFYGCTGIETPPALPASRLATACYYGMFRDTGLLAPPNLPATNIEPWCYGYMLSGTPLRVAPVLPAMSLAPYCYYGLFSGCSNLLTPPELPATQLDTSCYCGIFKQCVNLKSTPTLPSTTLVAGCYSGMFAGCSSITTAPDLPLTTLAESCYSGMFSGTGITDAPSLPATNLEPFCYASMFADCKQLETAPDLPATRLENYCYSGMFSGCEKLKIAPELPATQLDTSCYRWMFANSGIIAAPALPASELYDRCYYQMFQNCRSLQSAPSLPSMSLATSCYYGMFHNCSSLISAPELPAPELASSCYSGMFEGCTSLVNAPSVLPAQNVVSFAYNRMFYGCSSLEKAPDLQWKTTRTISSMFQNCSSLNYVRCLGPSDRFQANGSLNNWMGGVSPTGTFVKNADVDWSNRVPDGWTIINQGITLGTKTLELPAGRSYTLTSQLYPVDGMAEVITWSSSDPTVASVSGSGLVEALSAGGATITVSYGDFSSSCEVTVNSIPEGAVDMGLGVLWADRNLGASSPEGYGNYYAWAEFLTREAFTLDFYKYYDSGTSKLTKYCADSDYGVVDNISILEASDDAATVLLGGAWHIPTKSEFKELMDNCTWIWQEDYNGSGNNGYLVTSNKAGFTERSIFLPAGGYKGETGAKFVGLYGFYWTSIANLLKPFQAVDLYFDSTTPDNGNTNYYYGELIRPVSSL